MVPAPGPHSSQRVPRCSDRAAPPPTGGGGCSTAVWRPSARRSPTPSTPSTESGPPLRSPRDGVKYGIKKKSNVGSPGQICFLFSQFSDRFFVYFRNTQFFLVSIPIPPLRLVLLLFFLPQMLLSCANIRAHPPLLPPSDPVSNTPIILYPISVRPAGQTNQRPFTSPLSDEVMCDLQ